MTAIPARGAPMDLSNEAIPVGKRLDDICPIIPVPETAGVPDMTRRHRAPACTWPVVDAKSQPIGFLCIYAFDHSEEVGLWVYDENRARVQNWRFKRVPEFSNAIAANSLKGRLDTVIVASPTQQASDEYLPGLDGERDLVHVPLSLDKLAPKPTEPSGGSSAPPRPVL